MRAILEGLPYPQTLLQTAVRRIRAERKVTYPRAALIKACINRQTRYQNQSIQEELKMSLDESNKNIGYRLGRLFATLERIQIRAFTSGGGKEPNSTIRDRYYGSASGTPVTVFGTLIRLSKHHLAKIENIGEKVNHEKRLGQIMDGITDFPSPDIRGAGMARKGRAGTRSRLHRSDSVACPGAGRALPAAPR